MEVTPDGNFDKSPVLSHVETSSGQEGNPFTVEFDIAKDAVWDDGSPITSADFEFTWHAYLETKGTVATSGWDKITSVDTNDPKVAIVHFSERYADWWDLWGGNSTYILKKAAFPKGPNLANEMTTSLPFSAGPWKLQSWNKREAVLVRNARYWDASRKPLLDKVTFIPREDPNTEVNSLLANDAQAIYPSPAVGLLRRLDRSNVETTVGSGTTYEGLWFNTKQPPLDDVRVREALIFAVDREQIVKAIVQPSAPGAKVLNCAGWVPNVGKWCDTRDFADVRYNPAKAKTILTQAGWKLGPDGIFAKNGQQLVIKWTTVSGNKGREDTQALAVEQAKKAGIKIVVDNSSPEELFANRLPKLDFTMLEIALNASPDPSVTGLYACDQIPSQANDFSGQNITAWCNSTADRLVSESDRTVDPTQRAKLLNQVGDLVRKDVVWLPLYQQPLLTAWRSDRLGGPVGTRTSSVYSGFDNLYDWYLR